jgi:DNA-binding MarR family transcriptional regulator
MADECAQLVTRVLELRADFCRWLRPTSEWLEVDLTMSQVKVRFLLYDEQHVSMTRLAEALHVTLATGTGIVDRLVDHGWIRREEDSHDRRLVLCGLTREGRVLAERLQQAGSSHLGRLLAHLSAPELRTVVAGLEALCWAGWADAASELAVAPPAGQHGARVAAEPVSAGPRGR